MSASASPAVLALQNVVVQFPARPFGRTGGALRAVDGVSLAVRTGRTVGLVGESGCGKTTVGRLMCRLQLPTSGEVLFRGRDLQTLRRRERQAFRRHVQLVFQDPTASLNPRMTIERLVAEPLAIQHLAARSTRRQRVLDMLAQVGLGREHAERYPHELSGGQRQRVAIARSLITQPEVLICDEPTSSLDVSVQAQILNLLADLQTRLQLSCLFISHDLAVVEHLCHEIAVMYLGRIVEHGPAAEVCRSPQHPYTQALLAAVPTLQAPRVSARRLQGELPSPLDPPAGCALHPRCPDASLECRRRVPALQTKHCGWHCACHAVD